MLTRVLMQSIPMVHPLPLFRRGKYNFYLARLRSAIGCNRRVQLVDTLYPNSRLASLEVNAVQVDLPHFAPVVFATYAALVHHSPRITVSVAPASEQFDGRQHAGLELHAPVPLPPAQLNCSTLRSNVTSNTCSPSSQWHSTESSWTSTLPSLPGQPRKFGSISPLKSSRQTLFVKSTGSPPIIASAPLIKTSSFNRPQQLSINSPSATGARGLHIRLKQKPSPPHGVAAQHGSGSKKKRLHCNANTTLLLRKCLHWMLPAIRR